jgi:hypothetical protein
MQQCRRISWRLERGCCPSVAQVNEKNAHQTESGVQNATYTHVWMLRLASLYPVGAAFQHTACIIAGLQQLDDPNHNRPPATAIGWMHKRKLVLMPVCAARKDA